MKVTHYWGTTDLQFAYGGLMQAELNPSTDIGADVEDTNDLFLPAVNTLEDYSIITIEENDIFDKINGGHVLKIIPDTESVSLIIQIETFSDGDILITLP